MLECACHVPATRVILPPRLNPLISFLPLQQLDHHIARDISRGLQGLDKVVQEHGVAGVHGRLIDLIDCPPQLHTAVEVRGGRAGGRSEVGLARWMGGLAGLFGG